MGELLRHDFERSNPGKDGSTTEKPLADILEHDFGNAADDEPTHGLRSLVEIDLEKKKLGTAMPEVIGEAMDKWAALLDSRAIASRGTDGFADIAEFVRNLIRRDAPTFKKLMAEVEHNASRTTADAIKMAKYESEICERRAIIYRRLLHNDSQAEHYEKLKAKKDKEIEDAEELLNSNTAG